MLWLFYCYIFKSVLYSTQSLKREDKRRDWLRLWLFKQWWQNLLFYFWLSSLFMCHSHINNLFWHSANSKDRIQYGSEVVTKNSSHSWPISRIIKFADGFCNLQWLSRISVFMLGLLDFRGEFEENPHSSAFGSVVAGVVSRLHMAVGGFSREP